MRALLLSSVLLALSAGTASAQAVASFDASDAVSPISVVEGVGVKVGEGTVLRPVLGIESGIISNVFFEDTSASAAGLMRLIAQVGAGSLGRARLAKTGEVDANPLTAVETGGRTASIDNQGRFQYRADLRLVYDMYLSGNDRVTSQGGLGIGANCRGVVNPLGTWQFTFLDDLQRVIRATNFESDQQTNRVVNLLNLRVQFAPEGRALSAAFRFDNQMDIFESNRQQFSNRMMSALGARGNWQWLPVTRLYLDAQLGLNSGLGSDSQKVSSFPLTLKGGIQTLLSLNTTLSAHVGYTNGFYSSGPSFSAPTAGIQAGYRYSPLGRVTLGYDYLHADSINANFFRDHVVRASWEQGYAPFMVTVRPEVHLRAYRGITIPGASASDRNDLIFAVSAGAHYNFRNWLAATLDYRLSLVSSDFTYMPEPGVIDDPGFVRHELLVGARAAL